MDKDGNLKVLILNGSPRPDSNTGAVLSVVEKIFHENGILTETLCVPSDTEGCRGCGACSATGRCVIEDGVNRAAALFEECDGLLIGSPVYFSGISGSVKGFLDRLCHASLRDRRAKVGGGIVCVRRGGGTAALDALNHYLLYAGMCLAGSTYWPMVYGAAGGEALQDAEGMNSAVNLANNMVFMLRSFALGREKYGLPALEKKVKMNFIR